MTWTAVPVDPEKVTAKYLFDLSDKHRLIPENMVNAIDYYKAVSPGCRIIEIRDGDDLVGELIISNIMDGESATVDFVPVPEYFAYGEPYEDGMRIALSKVFARLMEGRNLRRLTAMIPKTRSRAGKALRACGFKKEGVMRDAIKFNGRPVEDVVIMGLLPKGVNHE